MITIQGDHSFSFACVDCGLFSTDGQWIYPERIGDCFELIYALSGKIFIREGDEEYELQKGDILILHPGKKWEGTQGSFGRTSFYWAQFSCDSYGALGLRDSFFPSDEKDSTPDFDKLLRAAHTPEQASYAADAVLLLILSDIELHRQNRAKKPPQLIRDVAEWVRVNSDKKLTVELTAKLFGYSSDYLSGVFNDAYGKGLKEYINEQKIAHIKNLLLTSNYPVKRLADILGYDNENQFINYFKYHTGLSPTKFRNQYYNTHYNGEEEK